MSYTTSIPPPRHCHSLSDGFIISADAYLHLPNSHTTDTQHHCDMINTRPNTWPPIIACSSLPGTDPLTWPCGCLRRGALTKTEPKRRIYKYCNQASKLWHYASAVGAHPLSQPGSMSAPPFMEPCSGNGSHWLSGYNNKVNCHLAARRSSNASLTDSSAQAADLVLFNEM